jgi:hypothetical protein
MGKIKCPQITKLIKVKDFFYILYLLLSKSSSITSSFINGRASQIAYKYVLKRRTVLVDNISNHYYSKNLFLYPMYSRLSHLQVNYKKPLSSLELGEVTRAIYCIIVVSTPNFNLTF